MSSVEKASIQTLERTIACICEGKAKGGDSYMRLLKRAQRKGNITLFVPWAAPPQQREKADRREALTLEWLFGREGLVPELSRQIDVQTIVMPADSYACRNNFNMPSATAYWSSVKKLISGTTKTVFIPSSYIERQPVVRRLMAEEAYAFEKMNPKTREKVLAAAVKYTGMNDAEAYEQAAEYAMTRAAEARFVDEELGALWISLNWPERDAMCGETPRVYAPVEVRTPWLKQTV